VLIGLNSKSNQISPNHTPKVRVRNSRSIISRDSFDTSNQWINPIKERSFAKVLDFVLKKSVSKYNNSAGAQQNLREFLNHIIERKLKANNNGIVIGTSCL
jgi:hypothetical protein